MANSYNVFQFPASMDPLLVYAMRSAPAIQIVNEIKDVEVLSYQVIDSTHYKITFTHPVLDNPGLRCAAQYTLSTSTPGAIVPTILGVVPEAVAHPTYVVLTTTEMTNAAAYVGDIQTLEAA